MGAAIGFGFVWTMWIRETGGRGVRARAGWQPRACGTSPARATDLTEARRDTLAVPGELVRVPDSTVVACGRLARSACSRSSWLWATRPWSRRVDPPAAAAAAVPLLAGPPEKPYLVVSSADPGDTWGRLVLVSAAAPNAGVFVTSLACQRTHMAGGRGTCLRQDPATSQYFLEIFDDTFTSRHRVPLTGVPSRTRVSPDGRWAAATVFEHGHSYAEAGFSTRTTLTDTATGSGVCRSREVRGGARWPSLQVARLQLLGRHVRAQTATRSTSTLSSGGVNYLAVGRSHPPCAGAAYRRRVSVPVSGRDAHRVQAPYRPRCVAVVAARPRRPARNATSPAKRAASTTRSTGSTIVM